MIRRKRDFCEWYERQLQEEWLEESGEEPEDIYERQLDAARERALDWKYQKVEDEHGNVYQPFIK